MEVGRGGTLGSKGGLGLGPNGPLLEVGPRPDARAAHAIAAERCETAAMRLRCAHARAHHQPNPRINIYIYIYICVSE